MIVQAAGLGIGTLQASDRAAIRAWVEAHRGYLTGRVLDYGCGLQPYREYVTGEYVGYDPNYPEHDRRIEGRFDAVLCTQVIQAADDPRQAFQLMRGHLEKGGYMLLTYHPSWYEVEAVDRWRFSKTGMENFANDEEMEICEHESILDIQFADFSMHMTYGIVARR